MGTFGPVAGSAAARSCGAGQANGIAMERNATKQAINRRCGRVAGTGGSRALIVARPVLCPLRAPLRRIPLGSYSPPTVSKDIGTGLYGYLSVVVQSPPRRGRGGP